MKRARKSHTGTGIAATLLILASVTVWVLSKPPAPASHPLIKELGDDFLTVESQGEGPDLVWILENRRVLVRIRGDDAELLELVNKESGFKHIVPASGNKKNKPGFSPLIEGARSTPPSFDAESRLGEDSVCVVFTGARNSIRQRIEFILRRGSGTLEVLFTCQSQRDASVEGDFQFALAGRMGEAREDDVVAVPAAWGLRKFGAPGAFAHCPKFLHPFRNWYACIDETTAEMLVSTLIPTTRSLPVHILTDFSPTRYQFGFTRERFLLEGKGTFEVYFGLTPLNRGLPVPEGDHPAWAEVRRLYRNIDLFLRLPSGPERVLVAPWGIARGRADPSVVQEGTGTRVRIDLQLNEHTASSPPIEVQLQVKAHGATAPAFEERETLVLGGWWRKDERTLEIPVPAERLHRGRFDVAWQVRWADERFEDRLNLGVGADRIPLPAPDLKTGVSVERAIARRMSQRIFKDEALDPRLLSYVLHQAAGHLKDTDGRIRDTVVHLEEDQPGGFALFVHFIHEGVVYRYDPVRHSLAFHQAVDSLYISELAEAEIHANPRIRMVQAPVLFMAADAGGLSDGLYQNLHLAAAATDLGFCIFGDEQHGWLDLPPGYEEAYSGRLGVPITPFLFESRSEGVPSRNLPRVEAVWNERGRKMAEKDGAPREPDPPETGAAMSFILEQDLTLEEAVEQARQVLAFEEGALLEFEQKLQLLWAAYGRSYLRELQEERDYFDNRRPMFVPGGVHRTVPSACGEYLLDVYLADETGIYQYLGKGHRLVPLRKGDLREAVLKLTGVPFEHPAMLVLFARRDRMKNVEEGEGFEEAVFAAQNMSLVAAGMDLCVGVARVRPSPGGEQAARAAWKELLIGAEEPLRYPVVGEEKNRAPIPLIPGVIVAAGPASGDDIRWRDPSELAGIPAFPEGRDEPAAGIADPAVASRLDNQVLRELFPQAGSYAPGTGEIPYMTAVRRVRNEDNSFRTELIGFAAETTRIAPEVMGYHGSIELALALNPYGRVKAVKLLHHRESAEHMERILDAGFLEGFKGKSPATMADVDIVSGATVTCVAIARAVQATQNRLFGTGTGPEEGTRGEAPAVLLRITALVALFSGSLCLLRASRYWRHGLLLASAAVLGICWNWSFTYTDLLSSTVLFGLLTAAMVAFVLVTTLLKGRVYCGWICPFGATQELAALAASPLRRKGILPGAGADPSSLGPLGRLRHVKYALLLVLLPAALITGIRGFMNPEPFAVIFAWESTRWRFYVGAAAVVLSLWVTRPFCRYLCPSGALLASLHRLKGDIERRREFDSCKGCGRCVRACPVGAVTVDPETREVLGRNRFECIGCEECVKATAKGACMKNQGR